MIRNSTMFLALLLLAGSAESAVAQSAWQATMLDGASHYEVYRLNTSSDTLVSPSAERAGWQQFPVSQVAELRRVHSDAYWYIPLGVLAVGTGVGLVEYSAETARGSRASGNALLVTLGATAVSTISAAALSKDEVHDLQSMGPDERRNVVTARIPVAFGSRAEGITAIDLSTPSGRRVSDRSWWGRIGRSAVWWSDGYIGVPIDVAATWWDRDQLYMLRGYSGDGDAMIRRGVALLYGRGLSFDRGHAAVAAGIGYEVSSFDASKGTANEPFPTYQTPVLALQGEMIWPLSNWIGFGTAATAGITLKGVSAGVTLSILFGDLD